MTSRRWVHVAVVLGLFLAIAFAGKGSVRATDGWASHYGPGTGVAMHFCTWTLRHQVGCGHVRIQSADTGLVVTVPVIDWCYCIVHPSAHPLRVVDLQWGVLVALGLPDPSHPDPDYPDRGLYQLSVERVGSGANYSKNHSRSIPDTAMQP